MRITPLDVRKQEFRKSVRGFDCDEVRVFLETLSHEYEAVLVDNKHLREQFVDQDEKISEYKTMERTLRDTLMTAERVMQDTRRNATKEGKLIVHDAELKARNIMEECRLSTVELRREIMALRQEKDNYLARFESLATAQIQFITNHKSDFEDVDNRLVELASSAIPVVSIPGTTGPTLPQTESSSEGTPDGDQWRDYETATSESDVTVSVETEFPETTVKETGSTPAKVSAASVDMAAMGIPVAAIPKTEVGGVGMASPWPPEGKSETEKVVLT
jgi:cell division initiation protein